MPTTITITCIIIIGIKLAPILLRNVGIRLKMHCLINIRKNSMKIVTITGERIEFCKIALCKILEL